MVTHEHVQRWLDDYIAAWRSYDRGAIRALFTDDVAYAYHPYDEPLRGADAVVDVVARRPRRARLVGGRATRPR